MDFWGSFQADDTAFGLCDLLDSFNDSFISNLLILKKKSFSCSSNAFYIWSDPPIGGPTTRFRFLGLCNATFFEKKWAKNAINRQNWSRRGRRPEKF